MGEARRKRLAASAVRSTNAATAAACTAESQSLKPEQSLLAEQPGADLDPHVLAVEKYDNFSRARNQLRALAKDSGQWAGLPIGIEGEELVVHPSYPWAHIFNKPEPEPSPTRYARRVRNVIYSKRFRCSVVIYERTSDGMVECQPIIGTGSSVGLELSTMGCSLAWGIEQESTALKLLGTLLPHHQFKYYLLAGMFIERSRRSNVTYMFRKLRPTIALVERNERMNVLCTLCMHPIGFYQGSWAGAMCPTDDVIAHLMMMRADEHMFWRYANQHPAGQPASGIGI